MTSTFTPVFTGGTGRSGTTIVGKLLARHELIHAGHPYEIKFVTGKGGLLDLLDGALHAPSQPGSKGLQLSQKVAKSINILMSEKRIKTLDARISNDWWERNGKRGTKVGLVQGFSLQEIESEVSHLRRNYKQHPLCSTRRFFYSIIASNKFFADSTIFVDTTPTNIERADHIVRLFEDAKFIQMQRSGRDTISSVLREPWGPKDPLEAIHWWKRKMLSAHKATQQFHDSQYLSIKLEELVSTGRDDNYAKLLKFLMIEDHSRMHEYFDQEITAEKAHIGRWKQDKRLDKSFHEQFEEVVRQLTDRGIQAY